MCNKYFAMEVDVSDEDQVIRMVQDTIVELGCMDIFVSDAGIIEWEPVTKITLECWNRILAVNLTGAMLCTREVARHLVEKKKGVILFTSSTIQFNPAYKEAAYRVSKTGVQVFAETVAVELAPYGSKSIQSLQDLIDSPNWAKGSYRKQQMIPKLARDLWATSQSVISVYQRMSGSAYAFLASEMASFATGANIVLDGGIYIDDHWFWCLKMRSEKMNLLT